MRRFQKVSAFLMALVLVTSLFPATVLHTHAAETGTQTQEAITPAIGDGKTWLHAVYVANGVELGGGHDHTYPLSVALTPDLKLGAAWDLNFLYLAVNSEAPNITKLQVNGWNVSAGTVTEKTVGTETDPGCTEYCIPLNAAGIYSLASGVNKVTVQIGEKTQTLYLIFENNNYGRLKLTGTAAATISADKYSASHGEAGHAIAYGSKAGILGSSLSEPAVVEVDLDITKLLSNSNCELIPTSNTEGFLRYITYSLNLQIMDKFCTTATNSNQRNELFKFGFIRNKSGQLALRHAYTENGTTKTADVVVSDTVDSLIHVRVEYTYAPDANGEISHDSVVSAKYFVDGKLITEGTNVRTGIEDKTKHIGTSAIDTMRVYVIQGSAHCDVAMANYSISSGDSAGMAALEQSAVLARNYLHAAYAEAGAEDADAFRLNVPLSADVKVGAAWDWDNLYLRFGANSGVTKVKVGGYETNVTGDAAQIAWDKVLNHCLKAEEIGNEFAITVTAENATLVGTLVLDTNDYERQSNATTAYGATWNAETYTGKLNSISTTDGASAGNNRDLIGYYTKGTGYVGKLGAVLNQTNIFEMDVTLTYLPESHSINAAATATREFAAGGLSLVVFDGTTASESSVGLNGMFTALVRTGNILYLAYWNGTAYAEVPIDIYEPGKEYHLRIEYSYLTAQADGETVDATVVAGRYFVNGKLVAQDDSVKKTTKVSITDGYNHYGYTISAVTLGTAAEETRVEAIVKNISVSNADAVDTGAEDRAAAAEVDALINALPGVNELKLTDKANVEAARAAYAALDADAAQYVTKLAVLEAAEDKIAQLQAAADKLEQDKAAADAVIAKIDAIGTVTLSSKEAIEAAEAAYAALTADQKELVTNYDVLTAARAEYNALKAAADKLEQDKAAAKAVDDQIAAIGTVTYGKAAAIASVRNAYDALTADQKELVENLDTLTAAETKIAQLQAQIDAVEAKITAIGEVTLSDAEAIAQAKAAFEALDADQQADVENAAALTTAEAKLAQLQAEVDAVEAKIAAIGEVTLSDAEAIAQAKAAFEALNAEQQAAVENAAALTAAETALKALQDAIADVIAKIDAIGTVTLESKADIDAAEAAYNALNAEQKALVTNYNKLTDAKEAYEELKAAADQAEIDQAAAAAVIAKIDAIGTVTLDSKSAIEDAEAAYAALTDTQKALVTNHDTLLAARTAYDRLVAEKEAADNKAAADAVIAKIAAIGTVTLDSEEAIEAAEAAYAALTDAQKALVTNHSDLTAARAAYDQLVAEKEAADNKAAADAVIAKIAAIGTVTLDSEEAIEAAEAAYAALTDAQKALVTNHSALTAARAAYDQLVADKEAAADKAAADAAIAKIEAIGTVTLESKLAIEAARAAYNALTSEQKAMVSAQILLKLTNAETALKALETPEEPPKTGDATMNAPVMLLLGLSVAGLVVVLTGKKRFF